MKYWLHPQAAQEHKQQVAFYEDSQEGLGRRYHLEFLNVMTRICASPQQSRIVQPPDIRRTLFKVFHFDVVYREVGGEIQVLAVAHHRRLPGYWVGRL